MNQQKTVVAMAKEIQANQHTPGSWTVDDDGTGAVVDRRGRAIARVNLEVFECGPNARLIAAAPDLVEALYAIMGIVGKMSIPDTHVADREAYRNARALLARIEGE